MPAIFALAWCSSVEAEVISSTAISYFTVGGKTPPEIYRNILDRGPRVGGARALASIGTHATQDGTPKKSGGVCRLTRYVITLDFAIQRPRIANEQVLPQAERDLWQRMSIFIEAHESQHKQVWQSCAEDLDHRIADLSAPTCRALVRKAEGLWQEMLASCDARQRAFDDDQSLALMRQPFMRRALDAAQ